MSTQDKMIDRRMLERADGNGYRCVSEYAYRGVADRYELEEAECDELENSVTYWYRRVERCASIDS